MDSSSPHRLADTFPKLERILTRGGIKTDFPPRFSESQIRRENVYVTMRDGTRLATDLYLPPVLPAPAIVLRTPYGRTTERFVRVFNAFAQHGYVVIAQDCRGTGDSEPEVWDYCIYECEDGIDFVEWVTAQSWFDGFLFSFGGSYAAATQWGMAAHPRMSAIAPEVAGLRVTRNAARLYLFVNAYPRAVGKGAHRVAVPLDEIERLMQSETLAGGYFNAPLSIPLPEAVLDRYPSLRTVSPFQAKAELWEKYCALTAAQRTSWLKELLAVKEFTYVEYGVLQVFFEGLVTYGLSTIPANTPAELCQRFHAPALFITGWYDWNLGDVLSSWQMWQRYGGDSVAGRSRLIVTPAAHHKPGYHEGEAKHPELRHDHRSNVGILLRWYEALQQGAISVWPRVIYYLTGANEWRTAVDWPVPEAKPIVLYLGSGGTLSFESPHVPSEPDRYTYDPHDPTPTVGGSIVSFLYPVGSVELGAVQGRADVVSYTTAPLERDLDVVGPLRLILHASSSAVDTDFVGRLSDVFPDGGAIHLQNGLLRTRYRDPTGEPDLLEPGRIYRFDIDLWATANRFKAGHRIRVDISSADFPRFDRNSNRGGGPGEPIPARQTIYHDPDRPSHLLLFVLQD